MNTKNFHRVRTTRPTVTFSGVLFGTKKHPVFSRRRRGVALLELAFAIPILIGLVLGIMEFGWLIKNNLSISNAAREGARAAAVGQTPTNIEARIKRLSAGATPANCSTTNGCISLQHSSDNGSSWLAFPADNTTTSPTTNGVPPGNLVRVTVNVAHRTLTPFPVLSGRNINVPVIMRREPNP